MTEAGARLNVSVALQYLDSWLGGNGAAAINNLMEDAATAEISRSQLWQWRVDRRRRSTTARRSPPTATERSATRSWPRSAGRGDGPPGARPPSCSTSLVLDDEFIEFLTLPAYDRLDDDASTPLGRAFGLYRRTADVALGDRALIANRSRWSACCSSAGAC